MAQIREELVLYDKFTSTFTSYIRQGTQAANVTQSAKQATQAFEASQKSAATQVDGLTSKLKSLAGAYVGIQGIKQILNLSDTLVSTNARLDMMNDGLQTTKELTDDIYASAMRARGAYTSTASFVAKLGNLAGEAFSSNQELIAFAEQINKQIVLSGASSVAADAAMLQLTQGLSSGALRGEELNSVLEQTPLIAKTIANYMGVTTGEMRELASEGAITAEVVKNAILSASDETNAAFESMPMTWSQVWTMAGNIAVRAMQPVLNAVNAAANSVDDAAGWITDHMDGVTAVLFGVAAAATLVGIKMTASAVASGAAWAVANAPILLVIAAVAALTYAAIKAGATFQEIGAVIGGVFGAIYAFAMNEAIIPIQNAFAAFANFLGNVFNNPVAAIIVLFYDMAVSVLSRIQSMAQGIEDLINKIPGVEVSLTSGIGNILNQIKTDRQAVVDASGWKEYVKPWEYVNYSDTISQGSTIGSTLGTKLDNFSLSDVAGSVVSAVTSDLSSIASSTSNTADNTKALSKAVNMAEEDIRSLVDVAERRYVNNINLTSKSPVIQVTGQNTGNTAADRQNLADTLRDILVEQLASGSVRTTARAVPG